MGTETCMTKSMALLIILFRIASIFPPPFPLCVIITMKGGDYMDLNDLQKQLQNFADSVKDLEGEMQVPSYELFTREFMQEHSDYVSFDDFLSDSGFTQSLEDIPDAELDLYVASKTNFSNWQEMLDAASENYILSKIKF